MRISHFFIDRPIFASVVSIIFVILGGVGFVRLPAFVMFEIWFLVPLPKGPLETFLGY